MTAKYDKLTRKQHVGARRDHVFLLRLRVEMRTLGKFVRPAEIGHELAHGNSIGKFVENRRAVQKSGGDAAVVFRIRAGGSAARLWIVKGLNFLHLRGGGGSQLRCRLNLRMVLDGNVFRLLQRQALPHFAGVCDGPEPESAAEFAPDGTAAKRLR